MPIGTSGPQRKDMKRSTLGVRRSVSRSHKATEILRPDIRVKLEPVGSSSVSSCIYYSTKAELRDRLFYRSFCRSVCEQNISRTRINVFLRYLVCLGMSTKHGKPGRGVIL